MLTRCKNHFVDECLVSRQSLALVLTTKLETNTRKYTKTQKRNHNTHIGLTKTQNTQYYKLNMLSGFGVKVAYASMNCCQPHQSFEGCLLPGSSSTYTRLSTIGDRAFPVAAARTWNSLPAEVTSSNSLQSFKTKLKSHLFLASFS